jgi:hypothetical protein
MQTREKFVSLSVPVIVPTATCVNKCPSGRKQEGKRNAMQRFATWSSVVGGISGATLTSVLTDRMYAIGRQLQVSVF